MEGEVEEGVIACMYTFELVSWCCEPSQPQRITPGLCTCIYFASFAKSKNTVPKIYITVQKIF